MSLLERSATAVAWGAAGALLKLFIQAGSQIALARILGPEQFGLVAVGLIVVGLAGFIADFGIAYGLIQKPTVSERDLRFVLGWQLSLGSVVGLSVFLFASPLAELLGNPRSAWIIQALSGGVLLSALSAVSMNMLKRQLDQRAIQLTGIVSYVVGYVVVGIPAAMLGYGALSLVVAWLVQVSVQLALMYARVRHPLVPTFSCPDAREMLAYGLRVLAANFINWIVGNADRVLVAKRFGATEIGHYSVVFNLLYNTTASLLAIVQSVLLAASSRLGDARDAHARAFVGVSGAVFLLAAPTFFGLAVAADTFVEAVYGQRWLSASEVLRPLALAMPMLLLWGLATPMLWASGRGGSETLLSGSLLPIWVGILIAASSESVEVLAWAVCTMYLLRAGAFVVAVLRLLSASPRDYLHEIKFGLFCSLIVAGSIIASDQLFRHLSSSALLVLIGDMAVGAVALSIAIRLVAPMFSETMKVATDQFSRFLPRAVARFVFSRS